jgi:hypothetical protein
LVKISLGYLDSLIEGAGGLLSVSDNGLNGETLANITCNFPSLISDVKRNEGGSRAGFQLKQLAWRYSGRRHHCNC